MEGSALHQMMWVAHYMTATCPHHADIGLGLQITCLRLLLTYRLENKSMILLANEVVMNALIRLTYLPAVLMIFSMTFSGTGLLE